METRSKVAAAVASVVPFSCIICFDEMNLTDRPPVVLPCGHTYVCAPCSKRLRRCMECREPLFLPKVQPPPLQQQHHQWSSSAPSMYSRGTGRYSPSATPSTPPGNGTAPLASPPTAQIPLPIPRNVVLMAMMEAAQRQESVQEDHSGQDEEDEEEYDLDRIISGMATLSGPCGTYAVKDREGLAVLSMDPRNTQDDEEKKDEQREPFSLEFGQTVQVVDFEDGVAKLARAQGYILATSSQLVKVGGPLDKSCRLEGLLDTVVSRGKGLQRTLDENTQIEESLRKQVETAAESEPSHPVITHAAVDDDLYFTSSSTEYPSTPTGSNRGLDQPLLRTPTGDVIIMSSSSTEAEVSFKPNYSVSPNSIDNSDLAGAGLPSYRRNHADDDDLDTLALGCGVAFFGEHSSLFGETVSRSNNTALVDSSNNNSLTDTGVARRSRTSSDPMAPWMHSAPMLTSSFDTVDFRTGLSGHRGLTTRSKPGSSPTTRRHVRSMGHHGGIGSVWGR